MFFVPKQNGYFKNFFLGRFAANISMRMSYSKQKTEIKDTAQRCSKYFSRDPANILFWPIFPKTSWKKIGKRGHAPTNP